MKLGIKKWPGRHEGPKWLKNKYGKDKDGKRVCYYQVEGNQKPNRHERRNTMRLARMSIHHGVATLGKKQQLVHQSSLGKSRKALTAVEGG